MTLPDMLEVLAVRLPDRFSLSEGRAGGTVKLLGRDDEADEWVNLGWWPKAGGGCVVRDRDLLALLMQEIEARGWHWDVATWTTMGKSYTAAVTLGERYEGEGDTPALALARALLAAHAEALERERELAAEIQ